MDTQNNNVTQETKSSPQTTTQIMNEPTPIVSAVAPIPKKNRTLFYILVSVLLAVSLAVGIWAYLNSSTPTPPSTINGSAINTQSKNKNLQPSSIVYSFKKSMDDPSAFYSRPIIGGERTLAKQLQAKEYTSQSDIYKDKVLIVTNVGSGDSDEAVIWFSQDSGRTYEKIFKELSTSADTSNLGPQITSARFSNDGSAIVFALLSANRENTVKEINLQTKNEKDLFTADTAGVFITAYNKEKNKLYYSKGCFNCDGNSNNEMLLRDLSDNSESVVYKKNNAVVIQTVFNEDLTKAVVLSGTSGEFLGASEPYTVEELILESKKFTAIATLGSKTTPAIGYTVEGMPFYSDNNKIYGVENSDRKSTLLFEDTQPILSAHLISKDMVITSSGSYDDFKVTNYFLRDKKSVIVLSGDSNTLIVGVSWN